MTWASGKVILIGEHAVVFGHPALAGALARGVDVAVDRDLPGRLVIPGWGIDVPLDRDHPVAAALCDLIDAAGVARRDFGLRVTGDLDPGVGLGSSAALAVATARALGPDADNATIARIAAAAEARFHGRPSGIDVAVSAHGGLGLFTKTGGWQAVAAPALTLAIGLSGEPKSTAAMLARVAEARAADPAGVDARMAAMGDDARRAAGALTAGEVPILGPLMNAAHDHLAAIGLSTPGLDAMVAAARAAGARGAKLTGAGGGGAVIALAPGREQAVVDAWRAAGRDGFVCAVGVQPS